MLRKKFRNFIILLILILAGTWLFDYLFVAKPKKVVTDYFELINDWKFNEAMKLEHDDNEGAYEAVAGILGKVTGVNINGAINLLPLVKSNDSMQFKVDPTNEKIDSSYIKNKNVSGIITPFVPLLANEAKVDVKYEVIGTNGKVQAREKTTIVLKKYGLSWRITGEMNGNINKYLKELYLGN